ncbi:MAG: hypothetical protein P4L43_09415 [Syntrophobacteraceae bacterium]|nr:hypothetical protein [Syntrophobacteraceae bacterium]
MANRKVMVTVGVALLVMGLSGIGLVQTGVIFPKAPATEPVQKSSGPPAAAAELPPGALEKAPGHVPMDKSFQPPPAGVARKHPEKAAPFQNKVQTASGAKAAPHRDAALKAVRRFAMTVHNEAHASDGRKSPGLKPARRRARAQVAHGPRHAAAHPFYPMHPVVIRFTFDPARNRPFGVASLHLGDRVRVKIRQVGQVGQRVYFTFSRGLNSPRGAILELKTMYSFERPVNLRGAPGYYVIQVQIYPDNRWRIMPRSLV